MPSSAKRIEHKYRPTEKQALFHKATAKYVLFGGARGPGKTRALLEDAYETMIKWPGIPVLLARRDLSDLKKTTEVEWRTQVCETDLYDPKYGGQHHKSENWYRLANGSTLYLAELKDWESWRSATLGRIYIEEAKETEEAAIRDLSGALRWTTGEGTCERPECVQAASEIGQMWLPHGTHPRYQMKLASNPGPGWLKARFWTPWKMGRQLHNHAYIPATVFDNPNLSADYVKSLMDDNPPQWVQNYVWGDWSAFDNMALPQFSRALHCWRDPIPYHKFKRIIGGVDYGSTGTEAHRSAFYLTAELDDGRYLTFLEYVEKSAPTAKLFALIKETTVKHRVNEWHADASQFIANDHLRDAGVPVFDAPRYQGAVKDGVNTLDLLMTPGPTGHPQWYYTENCTWLPAMAESYQMNEDTGQPIKKNDDEMDALRYSIMGVTKGKTISAKSREWTTQTAGAPARRGPSSIIQRRHEQRAARLKKILEAKSA